MRRAQLSYRAATIAALALLGIAGCRRDAAPAANRPAATAVAPVYPILDPIAAVPDKDRYKVAADTTGFFRFSPLQAAGADFDLKKNARLTMIKRGRGFSQIKTQDGQIGYVGTEDIAQLPPGEIAQEDAATLQAAQAAAGGQLVGPLGTPAVAGTGQAAARNGKKPGPPMSSYRIPSDADANVRLPEPDVKPKPTPTVSPTPSSH